MLRKKGLLVVVLLVTIVVFSYGQQQISVDFTNNTGYVIQRVYISPSLSDDWHENLLGEGQIEDGATASIDVPIIEEGAQYYDILAIDIDEDRYQRFEVDLTVPEERDIVFTFDDFDEGEMGTSGEDSYDQAYLEGYRDAWREAYKEAYSAGYRAGLADASQLEGPSALDIDEDKE